MRQAALVVALALTLGVHAAPALAAPITVYSNDFTGAAGAEWSPTAPIITTPDGERALGPFDNGTESLTLTGLPAHSAVTFSFDLYVLESWDGNGPKDGPDLWSAAVTGGPVLQAPTTFGHPGCSGADQSFPDPYPASNPVNTGAAAVGTLGYGTGCFGDSIYHFSSTFPHSASSVQFTATGSDLQAWQDEGWALDDVVVSVTPADRVPLASVDPGAGGQNGTRSLVIRGSGFQPGATPSFSGDGITVLGTTFKSATRLSAQIGLAVDAATGPRDVTVTNPDSTSGACIGCFTVDPAPKPTSVTAPAGTPDGTIDLDVHGSDFQQGAEVKVPGSGVSLGPTTFVSPTDLIASLGVPTTTIRRRVAVKVVNPDGGRGTCSPCPEVATP